MNPPTKKPLVFDLFCGLGGWSEAFIAEGYEAVGFDIEAHDYGKGGYPGKLVLRDVLILTGAELVKEFGVPDCIVASPPCQEYSYMAMPWSRTKAIAAEYRSGKRDVKELTALFDACFRIQREAITASGRPIPMVVENVRGAQPWVGRARWNFGSYYLWGDVPALMPITVPRKKGRSNFHVHAQMGIPSPSEHDGVKHHATGAAWFDGVPDKILGHSGPAKFGSKSKSRKAASAMIAKIPFPLAQWIARCFKPKPISIPPRRR